MLVYPICLDCVERVDWNSVVVVVATSSHDSLIVSSRTYPLIFILHLHRNPIWNDIRSLCVFVAVDIRVWDTFIEDKC